MLQWQIIEPLLPEAQGIGRPREVDLREIINGIFYVLPEGCSSRVHYPMTYRLGKQFITTARHWQRLGVWQKIHTQLQHQVRKHMEKTDNPTAGIIDSQSVIPAPKRGKFTGTMVKNGSKAASALSSSIP